MSAEPQLLLELYRSRLAIALAASAGLIIAVLYVLLVAPRVYEAQVVLLPAANSASDGMPGLLSQSPLLSGLVGMAGSDRTTENVAALKSKVFAAEFLGIHDLDEELAVATTLGRLFGIPSDLGESQVRRVKRFTKWVRFVKEDKVSSLVTVRFRLRSPERAAAMANAFAVEANRYLRDGPWQKPTQH